MEILIIRSMNALHASYCVFIKEICLWRSVMDTIGYLMAHNFPKDTDIPIEVGLIYMVIKHLITARHIWPFEEWFNGINVLEII